MTKGRRGAQAPRLLRKRCSSCQGDKPLGQFSRDNRAPDGRQRWCKACITAARSAVAGSVTITEKLCRSCGETKPIAAFHRSNISKDGYAWRCIPCFNRDYGIGSPEKRRRLRELRVQNLPRALLRSAKERAARLGLPFDLRIEDIVVPERCPALGIPITSDATTGFAPNSPTLDRIIPERGYVRGNVVVISGRANRLKRDETDPAIFDAIAAYIRRHRH
jgi:hypothetical protein